jgi:VAD1 Analog of StAR-related lipid transfer domain
LEKFYDLFLADDAPHSFDHFQQEFVRDRNVTMTLWENNTREDCGNGDMVLVCSRVLSFIHAIKSTLGMGPSEAKTTRRQILHRYKDYGLTVENITIVEGIPAADSFSVHDFWKIEAQGANHVIVSARFAPRFNKRTMLKSLIEKNILRETKEWFSGYSRMILGVSQCEKQVATKPLPIAESTSSPDSVSLEVVQKLLGLLCRMSVFGLVLLCLVLLVLSLLLLSLQQTIAKVNDDASLRQENSRLLLELQKILILHNKTVPYEL